jgi:thiol-disulfide isomerase/thioredoxin
VIAGTAFLGAAAAAVALYYHETRVVAGRSDRQPFAAAPALNDNGSASSDDLRFSFFDQPRALPDLRFADSGGRSLSLQDFRNVPILLNIWATWCVPCRKEMPALDRLQAELGASQLFVLPLSIDRQGLLVIKKFYEGLGLTSLGIYVDQSGNASSALNAVGVPTTLLINRDGREIGRKIGPAEWDSPEVVALLRDHLGLASSAQKASQ